MKISVKKFIAVLCSVLLIGAAVTPSVFALDFFNNLGDILGNDLEGILDDIFGAGDNNENSAFSLGDLLSNPGGILDALRERLESFDIEVSNNALASAIAAILTNENGFDLGSLLNSNDFLNRLLDYFSDETDTTDPEEESSEEDEASEEDSSDDSSSEQSTTLPPQTTYTPSTQPYTDTTADESSSEPEYSYVAPSVEYTDPLTTVPFAPVYEEDYSEPEKGVTGKMIAGIAILIFAGIAVIVVAVVLKKTKV